MPESSCIYGGERSLKNWSLLAHCVHSLADDLSLPDDVPGSELVPLDRLRWSPGLVSAVFSHVVLGVNCGLVFCRVQAEFTRRHDHPEASAPVEQIHGP